MSELDPAFARPETTTLPRHWNVSALSARARLKRLEFLLAAKLIERGRPFSAVPAFPAVLCGCPKAFGPVRANLPSSSTALERPVGAGHGLRLFGPSLEECSEGAQVTQPSLWPELHAFEQRLGFEALLHFTIETVLDPVERRARQTRERLTLKFGDEGAVWHRLHRCDDLRN